MKERKSYDSRGTDTRIRLNPARRAQLTEAGIPKFMLRLMEMRPAKCGHTETFAKRHD